jgi:hypothetical protein
MFWIIYIFAAIFLSFVLANTSKRYAFQLFILLLIALITPAKIEISGSDYVPSVFAFIFNISLEQEFSTRVLRPLAISLPVGLLTLMLHKIFKRKFF